MESRSCLHHHCPLLHSCPPHPPESQSPALRPWRSLCWLPPPVSPQRPSSPSPRSSSPRSLPALLGREALRLLPAPARPMPPERNPAPSPDCSSAQSRLFLQIRPHHVADTLLAHPRTPDSSSPPRPAPRQPPDSQLLRPVPAPPSSLGWHPAVVPCSPRTRHSSYPQGSPRHPPHTTGLPAIPQGNSPEAPAAPHSPQLQQDRKAQRNQQDPSFPELPAGRQLPAIPVVHPPPAAPVIPAAQPHPESRLPLRLQQNRHLP